MIKRFREARRLFPAVVLKEAEVKPGAKTLKLENTIVKFSRGSSALRYGVGFGAGSPYIRIRGQLTELGSNKALFIYEVDETGDWAFAGFTSSRTLQTQAASELADDVANFMGRVARGRISGTTKRASSLVDRGRGLASAAAFSSFCVFSPLFVANLWS